MRILLALIAVFMVSGAVAQVDYDANDVQFAQEKKPAGAQASVNVTCTSGYSGGGTVRGATTWSCKNPETGKVVSIECKVPPKMAQKMPKKMSGAELIEVCPTAKTSLKDVIITS